MTHCLLTIPTLHINKMSEKYKTPRANFYLLIKSNLLAQCSSIKTWVGSHSQLSDKRAEQEREPKIHMQLIVTVESISYTNQSTSNSYKLNQQISK